MTIPKGYLAAPDAGSGPGVLVLHAWWGLNATIATFCDRLAAEGFVAFAPDLYHGEIATTVAVAETLGQALDARHVEAKGEVAAAASFVASKQRDATGGIAVIGFSLGAYYALDLAATHPSRVHSVVLFYGSGGGDFSAARASYLGHYAGDDPYEPASNVDGLEAELRQGGRDVTFHRYPGVGHWFFEPDRAEAYDATAAALAWDRTLAFLRRTATNRTG